MGIDDIIRRQTITLPEPMDREQTQEFLRYVARQLPARISYEFAQFVNVDRLGKEDYGTLKVAGSITSLREPLAFDSFRSAPSDARIAAIKFETVPGWDLSDYRVEVVRLWDDVRRVTLDYERRKRGFGELPPRRGPI